MSRLIRRVTSRRSRVVVARSLLAMIAMLGGCGTIGANKEGDGPRWLSGPEMDLEALGMICDEMSEDSPSMSSCCVTPLFFVLFCVDIPISFVADTIYWPIAALTPKRRNPDS